ncbi:MAG TPA: HlyC/CorC family transporter [Candidatus Scybalocola faecavium]|nr:HlyC/CorC family transporter [Candidatus Scybalocola faecavium]
MDADAVTQLIATCILIVLLAFFSSAEGALASADKLHIKDLAEEGNKKALLIQKLTVKPGKLLSAVIMCSTLIKISAAAIITLFAVHVAASRNITGEIPWITAAAIGILAIILLIFGEIFPKRLGAASADHIILAYAKPLQIITTILTPFIFIFAKISQLFLKILGKDTTAVNKSMTESELLSIIDVSHEEGVIESDEKEMITNVVDFGDSLAKDVMVPRIDITFAPVDMNYDDLTRLFREEKYSRIPVYQESKDNIIGIVNLKDVFCYQGSKEDFVLKDILREPFFAYEYQKISDLMIQLRGQSKNMAIVLDEYGATTGLISLEDLLEEIVGEIRDEYDDDEEDDIQKISETEYIADGSARLDDIDELLGTELESDDYDSIAGYVIHVMEHIPHAGESIVTQKGIRFVVDSMEKNRIEKIHIYLPEKAE